MQFKLLSSAIALGVALTASAAPQARQSCPEAAQYGLLSVSPTTLSPGDTLTIHADFTCAEKTFGNIPAYTDYYVEVPENNNGHEPPILLARRTLASGQLTDTFTVQLPYAYYFEGAGYSVILDTTYPYNGTNGSPVYVVGGIEAGITITNISS